MSDTPDRAIVLCRTLTIIEDRGWAPVWSTGDEGPVNLRCAVAKACTELVGHSQYRLWYEAYLDGVHAVSTYLKKGVTFWEADVKSPAEVEAMLIEVINRLENDDIPTRQSRRRPRPGGL